MTLTYHQINGYKLVYNMTLRRWEAKRDGLVTKTFDSRRQAERWMERQKPRATAEG